MKKIKISIFAVLAIVMGIAASAFTANQWPETFDATYYYVGDNTLAQMQDPAKWLNSGTACNPTGTKPCTINWTGTRAQFDAHVENFTSTSQVVSECATKKP
jgi:hypothetical protein